MLDSRSIESVGWNIVVSQLVRFVFVRHFCIGKHFFFAFCVCHIAVIARGFFVQGLAFIALKTDGDIRDRARNTLVRWAPVLLLPIVAWVLALDFTTGNGISWLCTILAVVAVLIAWISAKGGREGRAFAGLSVFLAFGALAIFTAMYPNVLPSTLDPAYSLTIANASSSEYTLGVMTFVTCLGLPVVFVYQAWTYWVFRKRLHVDHIPEAHDATELAELPTK